MCVVGRATNLLVSRVGATCNVTTFEDIAQGAMITDEDDVARSVAFAMCILTVGIILGLCCSEGRRWASTRPRRTMNTQATTTAKADVCTQTQTIPDRRVMMLPPKIVVAPRRGEKFHRASCSQLWHAKELAPYSPCKTCFPGMQ